MPLQKIGILDFGNRRGVPINSDRIFSVVEEAVFLEKLGFSRIWYTEHFTPNPEFVWLSPDMLIPIVAEHTNRISLGVAGTSIRYNNPLKIAKDYSLLATMFGKRIDLGFSKGAQDGEYGLILDLIVKQIEGDVRIQFNERIKIVADLVNRHPAIFKPNLWNLTLSASGYEASLNLGTNCSRSLMHLSSNVNPGLNELEQYRMNYLSKFGKFPNVNICVAGTVQNNPKLINILKEAYKGAINVDSSLCGPPDFVYSKLQEIADTYLVDEIIFFELSFERKDRKRSFRYLSRLLNV